MGARTFSEPHVTRAGGNADGDHTKPKSQTTPTPSPDLNASMATVPNIMSTPISPLAGIPTEVLEHALLYLPGQDIIRTEAVRMSQLAPFRSLTRAVI
jgi:hypothetical protein